MKPNVAWMAGGLDACALYRQFLPHLHMPNSVFLYHIYGIEPEKFAHCQIACVQRLASVQNFEAMQMFKKMGMKIVYDLDDDMWAVPVYNPAFKKMKAWLPGFNTCASHADLITVSTQHLKLAVKLELGKQCPPVEVVENAIDFEWFSPVRGPYRKDRDGRVVVGWAGTNTHEGDTKKIFELMKELLRELPELEFEVAGIKLSDQWGEFGDRVRQRDFVPVAEFAANWASWQWDISLAPVEENAFNRSKSNIKALEAAALGIPCVMSDVGEYSKFVSGSWSLKESVLAKSPLDWKRKLTALIKDPVYRSRTGLMMQEVAKQNYDIRKRVDQWEVLFERLMEA